MRGLSGFRAGSTRALIVPEICAEDHNLVRSPNARARRPSPLGSRSCFSSSRAGRRGTRGWAGLVVLALLVASPPTRPSPKPRLGRRLRRDQRDRSGGPRLRERLLADARVGLAVWEVSGAMRAIMGALNRVYGAEENRPFVRRMILSFGLALVTATALGPGDRDAAASPRLLARQNRTRHVESQNRRRSVRASTIAAPQARQRGDHRASSPKSICTSAVIRLVSASTASTSSGDSRRGHSWAVKRWDKRGRR